MDLKDINELEITLTASSTNTIFLRAKATNEKQFLIQYEEKCNDDTEEKDCTIDHVYVYVLPDGQFEHLRIHTFDKMREDEDYTINNLQY